MHCEKNEALHLWTNCEGPRSTKTPTKTENLPEGLVTSAEGRLARTNLAASSKFFGALCPTIDAYSCVINLTLNINTTYLQNLCHLIFDCNSSCNFITDFYPNFLCHSNGNECLTKP